MEAEEALKSGAMALFEEKYGDRVRVIIWIPSARSCAAEPIQPGPVISVFLKSSGESSVASGVRRIEALTGDAALKHLQSCVKILSDSANLVKDRPEGVYKRIEALISSQRSLEKELEKFKIKLAAQSADQADQEIRMVNDVKVLAKMRGGRIPECLAGSGG